MRRMLTISLIPAVPLLLAVATLVGRGAGDGDEPIDASPTTGRPGAITTTTTTTSRPATTSTTAPTPVSDRSTTASRAARGSEEEPHFLCPEGGMDAVTALQQAVDDGHQPWRLSATDVASACTFGPTALVEPSGTNRYEVVDPQTRQSAVVDVAQPLGTGTVWVVTAITYGSWTDAAACSEGAMLPVVRDALEPSAGGVRIESVEIAQCQAGFARVSAIADNSACGSPGGACLEDEQVFLVDHGGQWVYLTSGTGISCATDDDLFPPLLAACQALGLR